MADLLWSKYRPKPGDTVVDVGAGHGGETFFLPSMVGEHGKVVAVEAAAGAVRAPAGAGQDQWVRNVEAVHVRLGAPSHVTISDDEANWLAGNNRSSDGVEVAATTFDDLCAERGITRVDWVKMNIEGAR